MSVRLVTLSLVAVVAFGCGRQKTDESQPAPAAVGGGPASPLSRASSRDRIAHARCQNLQTCSAIAKGKTYDDLDACFVHEAAKVDDDLHVEPCATIDPARLASCLTALKEKKCDVFFTSWPDACERDALCK
jgi:hypothetical protein